MATTPHRLDFTTALTRWDYAPAPESVKPEIADRFGASSLVNDLLRQLVKQATGHYTAAYDFSEA